MTTGPLAGITVLDCGTRISAPFCAGLLGELGADVIKVEVPGSGDFMRTIGPFVADPAAADEQYSLFWAVEGRGRKSVTLDLRRPEGQALFRRLAAHTDVVCENFRPGTLEGWGLDPTTFDPATVVVRISVFGQDGPYARRPGLDRLGIAYGGLLHLTGEAGRPPVRPGVTVSDYLTGVFAALYALGALYERDRAGAGAENPHTQPERPRVVDAPLYGAVLRVLEWTLAAYDRTGAVRSREGNRLENSAPLDNYPSSDGRFVCIVAGSDANFARLCAAMGRPDLTDDPRYATLAMRAAHADEINATVAAWARERTAAEIEGACVAHDVPVGTAYTAADIFADEHMAVRGDLVSVHDPVIGVVRQQAPFPRYVGSAPSTPTGAPRLGAHNDEVYGAMLGLSRDELAGLADAGII